MWSTSKNQLDNLSLPRQSETSNTGPAFSNSTSVTQTSIDMLTSPFSSECSFRNHLVQHDPAMLYPSFTFPSTIGPHGQEYADGSTLQDLSAQWDGVIEGPATDYHCLPMNAVGVSPLDPASTVQRPSLPQDVEVANARENSIDDRRVSKQRNGNNTLVCKWRGCKHQRPFSCERTLMRHVKTQHVSARSVDCLRCSKSFNRKDNMTEHVGRVHRELI